MSPSSATAEKHVASYQLLVDGVEIDAKYADGIGEIKVVDSLSLPDSCDLTLFINSYDKIEAVEDVDGQPFLIGSKIVLKAGAIDDQAPTTTVFDGDVVAVDADFGHGGVTLGIRALDRSHKLMRSRKVRVFKQMTVGDAIQKILQENGLRPGKFDPSGPAQDWLQQDNETDWEFISRHARNLGFWVLTEADKVDFVAVGKPATQTTIAVEWPDTIAAFHPRVTGVQQVRTVTAAAWDPKTKQRLSGQAPAPTPLTQIGLKRNKVSDDLDGGQIHISNSSATSRDEVESLATAAMGRLADAYVEADAHIPGNPNVKAGVTLEVKGVGEDFSGKYVVGTVRHTFRGGGAFDTFVSTATATPSSFAALTGGNGAKRKFGDALVIGLVTNNKDPDKLGRFKVKFPALDESLESDWLRIATANAGPNRGVLMLPQVGDEVLVGFENGDTRRGYVIGSLWNGKEKPHGDHLKGADESDGSFSVQSDKQFIATSQDEMKLTSTKKMTVEVKDEQLIKVAKDRTEDIQGNLKQNVKSNLEQKVTGNFKNEANGSTTVKANGSVTIESTASVTIKAPSVTVEGQAQLSLKAPQVSIQGSAMVNISGGIINLG
jgi:phage protein D/phage baseplate assembly protein gpV